MKNILQIGIYNFINGLFVYKYSAMFTPHRILLTLTYLVLINIVLYSFLRRRSSVSDGPNVRYYLVVGLLVLCFLFVMNQFNPGTIAVGRYPALHQWIASFLRGEFPYQVEARPSGLPFLFFISLPFYVLGDLGLLQIIAFLAFSVIIRNITLRKNTRGTHYLLLLTFSPVFLYELVVRSDLFSNMVLVILYGWALDRTIKKTSAPLPFFLLGAFGGCVLATRMVAMIAYILILGYSIRECGKRSIWLIAGNFIGFTTVTVPFLVWDYDYFLRRGPFFIQGSYISVEMLVFFLMLTILESLRVRTLTDAFRSTTAILFFIVLLPFLQSLVAEGWNGVILHDKFDISYFAFCLPFLILSVDLGE